MTNEPDTTPYDTRVAPILARGNGDGGFEVLAFAHPDAGMQLVKGSPEPGENTQDAARRELEAKAGIAIEGRWLDLGRSKGIHRGEAWHFFLAPCPPLADTWTHRIADPQAGPTVDERHLTFRFFWQPLTDWFEGDWDERYIRALRFAQAKLDKLSPAQRTAYAPSSRTDLANAIVALATERGHGKSICPSEVARHIGGPDETVWRGLMKPIRSEALRLAANGSVAVTRKGKPVEGPDFKGVYRISLPPTQT